MLYVHIKWRYRAPSEFSSWSVSLLYVLVHAVRKAYYEDEHDVLVYGVHTRKLPATNGLHSAGKLLEDYAKGEYLIHGKVENAEGLWKAMEFKEILRCGFFEVFWSPKKRDKQQQLFERMVGLRKGYLSNHSWNIGKHLSNIQKMAQCFGKEWEGVLIIALLTVRNDYKDSDSVDEILSTFQATSWNCYSFCMTDNPFSSRLTSRRVSIQQQPA